MPVFFHNEDVDFPIQQKNKKKRWLKDVIEHLNFKLGNISVIFCSDDYLLSLNKKHLNHNYYTDVITFNYCSNKTISGDIFVSVDRVRAFSIDTNTSFLSEINRVIVHGVLHLCGFDDKKPDEILRMRKLEDLYLTKL
ncbi:MAG: rRNA maturation RNase YbeY [Bacteroidota bacterium]|nr:rRNA maturation RNase YbeY [Bacteroidota bacterium]